MPSENNNHCFYCHMIFSRHDNLIKHYKHNKCNIISRMSQYDHYIIILPFLEKSKFNQEYRIPLNSIFSDNLKYNTIKTIIEEIYNVKNYMEDEIKKYVNITIRYINKQNDLYIYSGNRCTLKEATDLLSNYLINKLKTNMSLFKINVINDDSFDYDLYDTEIDYLYILSEKSTIIKKVVEKMIRKSKIKKLLV